MNCRSGDLAVIINAPHVFKHHIGRIVSCATLVMTRDGFDAWMLETPFKDVVFGRSGICTGVADMHLRPIRGQEGQDETLTRLDVPIEVSA
jgi:hypothetical protein